MKKNMNRLLVMVSLLLAWGVLLSGCDLLGLGSEPPTIVGTWKGIVQMDSDPIELNSMTLTFGADGSFEALVSDLNTGALQSGSNRGSYTINNGTLSNVATSSYDGIAWAAINPPVSRVAYLIFNESTLTYAVDMNQDETPDYVWTLYRQP